MGRGRAPCCDKMGLKKGPWTAAEDMKLIAYINKFGHQNWRALPKHAGLLRCGKSCRLRWINYLKPDLKRGNFTREEEETIIKLHELLGNKWSKIASCLPGRTDNEIKNVWNTHLKKRLVSKGPRASPINESNESSSNSYSSNSTISYCNHGEGESTHEEQMHLMIQPESPPEVSKMVHLEMLQEQKQSVEVKEIPIESCTDFWDMLEDDSILSSETADTEGKEDMWARHPKEQLVSERYSYGSISSSTSGSSPCSSYVLRSNEVDGIGSEEQKDALFKSKSTPTDDQDMISREVEQESSKKILEIYTEPERDFWSMLEQLDDDLCAFPSSDGAVDGSEGHQKTAPGEESKDGTDYGWTSYFENEPELWMIDNDNHQSLMKA